jgi:putative membrane protein
MTYLQEIINSYNTFFFFKALHIIGFVSWFAALFYLPRLFIYHTEAMDMEEPKRTILMEQMGIMQRRLYTIIMTPALFITLIGGFTMLYLRGWTWWTHNIWMHWKFGLILLLIGYHHYSKGIMKRLEKGEKVMTSTQFRLYNEVTTLFLVAIVLLAVYKDGLKFFYALAGLVLFGIALGLGVKWYKKIREGVDK